MATTKKPGRWKRFTWFLERAFRAADDPGSAGYQSERFRADMYNGTDGGAP
jgi:hypothetical protein